MPDNDELTRADYIRALLGNKNQYVAQGGNMLNPALSNDISGLAALDTSFNGVQPQEQPKQEKQPNGFDQFMNNVLGFVDEIAAKFGAGFVNGWEGILDFGATALGAMGWEAAAEWAKQDIGSAAAEWSKTAFGLGSWYNRLRGNSSPDEFGDIVKGLGDLGKAAFFAKNDLGDMRELSDKHYRANDEALQDMGQFGEFLGGAAHSIGFMLPSIMTAGAAAGAGSVAQQAVSLGTMGVGAAGKGSEEALNEGASAGKALGYGALTGAAEAASELVVGKALGLVGLGTGKIAGVVGKGSAKTTAKIGSKLFAKQLTQTMFEEGMEEVSTAVLEPLFKSVYKGKESLKDYKSMDFWFGSDGHFNESVLGQFTSGAFVGGLSGGIHQGAVYRKVGADGYVALQNFQNLSEEDAKMAKLEVQKKTDGKAYTEATNARTEAMEEFIKSVDKLMKNGTEAQKKAFAEFLTNKNTVTKWEKEDKNLESNISKFVDKFASHESAEVEGFRNEMNRRFGTDFEYEIEKGDIKTDKNGNKLTAYIDGNKIVINENVIKQKGGSKIAHEYMAHHLLKSLPSEVKSKLFRDVQNTEWYKNNKEEIDDLYGDQAKAVYNEETFALYMEHVFEGDNVATQIENMRQVFGSKGLFSGLQRILRGAKKFKSPELIKQYAKTLDKMTKAMIKSKIYSREDLSNFIKQVDELKQLAKQPAYSKAKGDELFTNIKTRYNKYLKNNPNFSGRVFVSGNYICLVNSSDSIPNVTKKFLVDDTFTLEERNYILDKFIEGEDYNDKEFIKSIRESIANIRKSKLGNQRDGVQRIEHRLQGRDVKTAKDVANGYEGVSNEVKYSKEVDSSGVTGKYTVGSNKKPLEVRFNSAKKIYEVIVDGKTITEAQIGGETVERTTNLTRYRVESDVEDVSSKTFDTLKEAEEYAKEKGIDKKNIVEKPYTIANYSSEGGETIKFDTVKNVRKYLNDIKAEKVKYEQRAKQPPLNKPESRDLTGKNMPKEAEMKKADETPVKNKFRIFNGATVYASDDLGATVDVFKISRKAKGEKYTVDITDGKTAEIKTQELSYKQLRSILSSYTNVSNKKENLQTVQKNRTVQEEEKITPKKEDKKSKSAEKVQKSKKSSGEEKPNKKASAKTASGEEIKVDVIKQEKTSKKAAKQEVLEGEVEILSSENIEVKDSDIVDEAPKRTAQDIKNEADLNNVKTYTLKEVENTVRNISKEILKIYKLFEPNARVKYNSESFDTVSRKIFEIINKKNVSGAEISSELEKIFTNVKFDAKNNKTLITNDFLEIVGEDLMKNIDVANIVKSNVAEMLKGGKEAKVHALKRIFKEVKTALRKQVSSLRHTGDKLAVLIRERDRLRKSVGRFAEVSNREVSRSGFNLLLEPFEKLHRLGIRFDSRDFVDGIDKILEVYEQNNWEKNFPELPFSEEIRDRLIYLRERTAGGRLVGADLMDECIKTIRAIKELIKKAETKHIEKIVPYAAQTIDSIQSSNYGKSQNVLARWFRKYKRGFLPTYTVIEEILGGNSAAVRTLVYDMQNAYNAQTLYLGKYHDELNEELKQLNIKKTLDTKKLSFRNHELTIDQAMGLYLSTQVQANYDAIEQDGLDFYDEKTNRLVNIAESGQAEDLKTEIEQLLPKEYQDLADFILKKMNGRVKKDYMGWFTNKYGEFQMRNEIGEVNDKSYWTLKRSYVKMSNITKAVSNPDAVFSNSIRRNDGGGNQVLLTGALSTFDAYINKLSREIFVKPVYEDALAVLNTKVNGKSPIEVLAKKLEADDLAYLRKSMGDLLGVNKRQVNLLDKMVSAFSVAKLSLNIGSMGKQFASAFTSNIPIRKTAKALIERWSPEARAEFKKLYDGVWDATKEEWIVEPIGGLKYREASEGVIDANADSLSNFARKLARYGMKGISKVDLFTVSTGAYALMIIGRDQFDYEIGSEDNIKFVRDHWAEYELSQIGSGQLSKNTIQKGDSLVRYLFGFLQGANIASGGSQIHKIGLWLRNKNIDGDNLKSQLKIAENKLKQAQEAYKEELNRVNESEEDVDTTKLEELREEYIKANTEVTDLKNKMSDYESFKLAGGNTIPAKMAAGLLAQGALIALINALMKRIKGRKDWDELDVAEEGLALAMAIGVDWVPMVNFFSNLIQGYEVTVPAVDIFNQMAAIFKSGKDGNYRTTIRQIALLVGDMTGIPFQTIYSYIYGTLKGFDPAIAYEMRSVLYGASLQSATTTLKTYADKGNLNKTTSMVNLIMNKYKTGSSTDEINKELADLYISGNNALPKTAMTQYTDDNGDVVKLTNEQMKQFTDIYSQSTKAVSDLMKLTDYRSATNEEKAKAIKKIYDAYYALAKAKVTGKQPEGKLAQILALTNGNVSLAKYILSLQKIANITQTSKKTRKELVLQYINRLRGYTKAEKTVLMYLAGYSVSGKSENLLISFLVRNGASRKDVKDLL